MSGPGEGPQSPAATVSADHRTLENSAVKLVIEPDGAIASLIDKTRGNAELAATIGD